MTTYEVRMIGADGRPVRTLSDITQPRIKGSVKPGALVLADYCFNEEERWIRPEQLLHDEDIAAVVYGPDGQIERMVVCNHKVFDEEQMLRHLRLLQATCVVTGYPAPQGRNLFLFFVPPDIKNRLRRRL